MTAMTTALQVGSISIALIGAGGIATLSAFDIPEIQSQPASRSLPMVRWLFSRGSHVFPTASGLSSLGFASLAVQAHTAKNLPLSSILRLASNSTRVNGYLAAALLTISIAPWTARIMIPTNFALIKLNEELGGARSARSAETQKVGAGERSAEDSVNGKGETVSQWTDLSGAAERTEKESTPEQDRRARELLSKFSALNWVRAILMAGGGVVGLVAALS